MTTLFFIITLLIMLAGLAGTVIPLLPGIPLIFAGYLLFGLLTHWQYYSLNSMVVLGMITALSVLLDYWVGAAGAKKYGASSAGVWGALIGTVVGIFTMGFFGIIFGPLIGAVAGELLAGKPQRQALNAGMGAFLGFLAGSLFKLVLGLVMIALFFWWVVF